MAGVAGVAGTAGVAGVAGVAGTAGIAGVAGTAGAASGGVSGMTGVGGAFGGDATTDMEGGCTCRSAGGRGNGGSGALLGLLLSGLLLCRRKASGQSKA
jgi:hypothetical protein